LTHHSKDPFVLNEILQNAKTIFAECDIVKFDKDIAFVNELVTEIPKLVYENVDVKKYREERDKTKDEQELQRNSTDANENSDLYDYEKEIKKLNLPSKLNLAYKTIEIIGQLLKNYYGSLKGEKKFELGEEAYFIGLRSLKSFFVMLSNSIDLIVKR
jgi:hypothetical protein